MSTPVLIISDTHYHKFSQYASIDATGVNSRLADTLRATDEAFATLHALGGTKAVHCGDVFHVRGAIAPTVFNPVRDRYLKGASQIHIINGNHDLESNDSIANASTAHSLMNPDRGVIVHSEPEWVTMHGYYYAMVPWESDLTKLRATIKTMSDAALTISPSVMPTLILHAALNGVIKGLPDHGLEPEEFAAYNFQRVFCGHYHNHVDYDIGDGKRVTSVGALTHQNWGDTESKAGFLMYYPDRNVIEHYETHAPKFVKVPVDDLLTTDDSVFTDNFVKVTDGEFNDPSEIQTIRDSLIVRGAKAVAVEGLVRKPAVTRSGSTSTAAPTLASILGDYMDRQYPGDDLARNAALRILGEVS